MINIIAYEPVVPYQSLLINMMIRSGFGFKLLKKKWHIEKTVDAAKPCVLLCSVPKKDEQILTILTRLKTKLEPKEICIILYLEMLKKDFLKASEKSEFPYRIFKTRDIEEFKKQFLLFSSAYTAQLELRKHVRVTPETADHARIVVSVPGITAIAAGMIINLSLGGILFQLRDQQHLARFAPNMLLENAAIHIRTMRLPVIVKLVAIRDSMVAIKITRLGIYEQNILCSYIYERIDADFDAKYPEISEMKQKNKVKLLK